MKIIYMGTPELAVPCLETLHHSPHEITCVVTQPDRPKGRGKKLTAPPIKIKAQELGLKVIQPEDLNSDDLNKTLINLKADLMVVVAYSILPDSLLSVCAKGAINLHGSLLPAYRGAAPIQWAIAKGETETGVSIFQLDEKMDHGMILKQGKLPIEIHDTAGSLGLKMMDLGKDLILETVNEIELGTTKAILQDHSKASFARKLKKEDGKINWNQSAAVIHNKIRGFNPFPICYSIIENMNKVLRFRISERLENNSHGLGILSPGEDGYPEIGCSDKNLKLIEVQLEGKPTVNGKDFLNGLKGTKTLKLI